VVFNFFIFKALFAKMLALNLDLLEKSKFSEQSLTNQD